MQFPRGVGEIREPDMKDTVFWPVTALMKEVGRQIAMWRNDSVAKHLYSAVDFKTEADRRAHDLVCAGLARLFPGVEVVSEESPVHLTKRPDKYWLVDPIDGTASWYHGFDGFVTQAAYIECNVPLFGIVHAPVHGKTWTAVKGGGAHLSGKALPRLATSERLIVTDNTKMPHGIVSDIIALLPATGYLESGSLGLKSVLVADGSADLFVKDVCVRDWDLAPAAVILQEVGGCLALTDGSPYVFDGAFEKVGGFIVARDAMLMSKAVDAFARIKKNQVSTI
jgi:fructose-1,6-bisphosphatase/inositol monophosphatase family enzyme